MGVTGGVKTVDTTNLVFLMDASNAVSYTSGATKTYNLIGGQTGSVVNNTSYSSEGGGSWLFDGTDEYIECDTFTNIVGSGNLQNYTIEAWIKGVPTIPTYDTALGSKTTSWHLGGYGFTWHPSVGFFIDGSWGSSRVSPSTGLKASQGDWWCVAVTYDGSTVRTYAQGQAGGTQASTGDMNAAGEQFCIGGTQQAWADWDGKIADVRIYNKALSATEVLQNYNDQKGRYD